MSSARCHSAGTFCSGSAGIPAPPDSPCPGRTWKPLRQRLLEIAGRELAGVDLRPHLHIDASLPLSSIGGKTFRLVERFAPFGQENPCPSSCPAGPQ